MSEEKETTNSIYEKIFEQTRRRLNKVIATISEPEYKGEHLDLSAFTLNTPEINIDGLITALKKATYIQSITMYLGKSENILTGHFLTNYTKIAQNIKDEVQAERPDITITGVPESKKTNREPWRPK